jgi:hypothetical protein
VDLLDTKETEKEQNKGLSECSTTGLEAHRRTACSVARWKFFVVVFFFFFVAGRKFFVVFFFSVARWKFFVAAERSFFFYR